MVCCQNKNSTGDCIEYIDSLKINLENTTLRVALIDLVQESNVRPYSIFFDNHLIVLNKKNSFYAFHLDCLVRDTIYEQKLNTKEFKKAFTALGNLYRIDAINQAFKYEDKTAKWIKSNNLPLFNSTPIYENDKYICYTVCHGEFGGYVFFYNKYTEKITFVPATCAVSLIEQQSGGFYIVSNLSHMIGRSYIKSIENPDFLFKMPDSLNYYDNYWDEISLYRSIMSADNTIRDNQIRDIFLIDENGDYIQKPQYVFEIWEKLITAGFKIKDENYYITENYGVLNGSFYIKTDLTKLYNDSLVIINTADTIFSELPSSHGEITRKINNNTVIDYTQFANDPKDWSESKFRNLLLTTFIINDTTLIRINWIDWKKEHE